MPALLSRLARFKFTSLLFLALAIAAPFSSAEAPDEIRALWAQAWVGDLHSPAGIDKLISDARSANFNTLIVQMRRRGDTLYFSDIEPRITSGVPGFANFDPLEYILQKAREQNPPLEVHAWIVVFPVDRTGFHPDHITTTHPEYLTQTRDGKVHVQLDPAHPGTQKHLVDVGMELVTKYDVDGLHYDYIRYDGNQYGYNPVAIERFQKLYNRTDIPFNTDSEWSDFRRDQVTNVVRSLYLHAMSVRPDVKVSASTITWSPGPANINSFHLTRPYSDILSDWPEWMREGILDLNVPMAYFREHNAVQKADYRRWANFIRDTRYNRHAVIGPALYLNELPASITQMRESRNTSPAGNRLDGVAGYTYHQISVDTSVPFSEFRRALTQPNSGYDPISPPIFAEPAAIPEMPWKTNPTVGHLMGFAYYGETSEVLDGATIHISGPESRTIHTDGTGFYGFVDLLPGNYQVQVEWENEMNPARSATVNVGEVTKTDLQHQPPPPTTGILEGHVRNAANGKTVSGATIHLEGPENLSISAEPTGFYRFPELEPGNYTVFASLNPETEPTPEIRISISIGETTVQNLYFQIGNGFVEEAEIIVDDQDPEAVFSGLDFRTGSQPTGFDGSYYSFTHNSEHFEYAGYHSVTYTPDLPASGFYRIDTWYPGGANRAPDANYTISDGESDQLVLVNQQINGSEWFTIAENIYLEPNKNPFVRIDNEGSGSVTMFDAIRWVLLTSEEVTHEITTQISGNGKIEGLPEDGNASHGAILELEAIGENGYIFSHWSGKNGWGTENPLLLPVGANLELSAIFISPYLDWLEENLSEEDLDNPELTAPDADPDGSGIPNLLKFAFGMTPDEADYDRLPKVTANQENLQLTFLRQTGEIGAAYRIEVSADLTDWQPAEDLIEEISTIENGDSTETVTLQISAETESRLFVRLRVEQN